MNYAKAVVAALIAGLGSLAVALDDNHLTGRELVTAAIATLLASGLTYAVPNKQP